MFATTFDDEDTIPGVPPVETPSPPPYIPPTERFSADWDDGHETKPGVAPAVTPEWAVRR